MKIPESSGLLAGRSGRHHPSFKIWSHDANRLDAYSE
jgi:hypothetical protein